MSWKVSCVMSERMKFIVESESGQWSMSEMCRRHGVSRKTGYKWLRRYMEDGVDGLKNRSRAPQYHPNAVDAETEEAIVLCKQLHMLDGPRKVRARLLREQPDRAWPAASTMGDLLKRRGLVVPRKTRRHATPSIQPLSHCAAANEVWCIDFKGWFLTGDGTKCEPLTIMDAHSRFLLRCQTMTGHTGCQRVKPLMEAAFREFGLPRAIRSDNGPPFASTGLAGLSKLAVWWMRLGIVPERIRPGCPQDNGRHERMHRTLKQAAAAPPRHSMRAQQRAFDAFRDEYNHQRPHEALGQQTPASHYEPSPRTFPARLPDIPDYPREWRVRKVKKSGQIKWRGHEVRITDALVRQHVALAPRHDGLWTLYFMTTPVGIFDERLLKVRPLPRKETT